ncbi:MAG: LamG domain-containing protein [Erythrobacter sp.]
MLFRTVFTALAAIVALSSPSVAAQDSAAGLPIWQGYTLEPTGPGGGIAVKQENGREILTVARTGVMLGGVEFSEGVIEFDVRFPDRFGFGGLVWHASEDGRMEYFYLRQHKSGQPDAGQYTPIRNGLTSWQIYTDRNGIAPFSYAHEGWNRLRLVVVGDSAEIFFNGSTEPMLHIADLAADTGNGGIGFRSSGPFGEFSFANLVIRPLAPGEGLVGAPAEVPAPPPGVIARWSVSQAFDESAIAGQIELPAELSGLGTLGTVAVEPFGIADLSRLAGPDEGSDTVLVSTRITAERAKRVRLAFGYSDRVRLFLNGELVFDGVAGWRSRDHFFLGTIGFSDAAVLDLDAGENTLTAAVSETFGGWGFAGAIAERDGLHISP